MTQIHEVAILIPLMVGVSAVVCTILIHALAVGATINFVRYERTTGCAGTGVWIDLAIVVLVIPFAFVAHLVEIALWAAFVHQLRRIPRVRNRLLPLRWVNYTTLGY